MKATNSKDRHSDLVSKIKIKPTILKVVSCLK